ncbi:MAG: DUF6599 family protein [Ignavibacteriaceae bacterium]
MNKIFLILLLFSVNFFSQDLQSVLPDSAGNWKKAGVSDTYVENELYRLIDGGADIFIEYGFNQIITQRYINPDENIIDVEVYEMKDSSSAYGIFSLFTLNSGDKINFNSEAYAGEEFLLFWKRNYYVSLTGINFPGNAKEDLLLLAKEIEVKLPPGGKPSFISMFDESGNLKITYIKGNLGFYNISRINFGREFKLEEGIHFIKGTVSIYIFRYGSEDECLENYSISLQSFNNNPGYIPQYSEPDLNLYRVVEDYLLHRSIKNNSILLVSKNRNELEEISKEIEDILQR